MEDAGQKAVSGPGNIDREGPPPREPRFWIREAAFSPDNKFLFTVYSFDGRAEERDVFPKTASLWDVATGKECWSLKAGKFKVIGFAFMPDSKQILITDDDGVKVLDAADGKFVRSFVKNKRPILCVAVSPDGKLALTGDMGNLTIGSDIVLWDVGNGKPIQILQSGNCGQMLFSKNGRLMLAGGAVQVWDVAKRDLLVLLNPSEGWIGPAALSPDGKLGVASKYIGPIPPNYFLVLWEATTGKPIRSLPEDFASAVAFTPDGKGVLAGNPQTGRLVLWDVATGKEVWTARAPGASIFAFSADGKLAFTNAGPPGPANTMNMTIWDTRTGESLRGWSWGVKGPSYDPSFGLPSTKP
jgi:WD40 repeat protein